jgi:hypothetical protein
MRRFLIASIAVGVLFTFAQAFPAARTSQVPQCSDGVDNDGDTFVDFGGLRPDPQCGSADDDSEAPSVACMTVADDGLPGEKEDGEEVENLLTAVDPADPNPATNETTIGRTGTERIEAIAFQPGTGTLYAADAGQLGTLNLSTGAFTPSPSPIGTGSGAKGAVELDNVDGLTFDPATGVLYGSQRQAEKGEPDLLIQIDPATGAHVPAAFGPGVDYVVIDPVTGPDGPLTDIDDLAFVDGVLFAVANEGGDDDRLVRIDPATGDTTDVGPIGFEDVEGLGVGLDGGLLGTVGKDGDREVLLDISKTTAAGSNPRVLDNGVDYEAVDCVRGAPHPPQTATVAGIKFADLDRDGERDGGEHPEPGVEGVEIHLFNAEGSVHEHTTTGHDGTYSFTVPPGTYTVCETVPEGQTETFPTHGADCSAHQPDHGTIGPVGYQVTVEAGGGSFHNDFGNAPVAAPCEQGNTISGVKFDDADRDGTRDEGEGGVAGVTVVAQATGDPHLRCEATSGHDGSYTIRVPDGTFIVCEVLPEGRTQTFPKEGPNCEPITGQQTVGYEVTVRPDATGIDFGNTGGGVPTCQGATISGTKFDDADGDGTRDEGEAGVPGVTIVARSTADPSVVCQATTGDDGTYRLSVAPGTYTVCEVLPDADGDGKPDRTQTLPKEGPNCEPITGQQTVGYEVTVPPDATGIDFGNTGAQDVCSGPPRGPDAGLLLPDTIGQTLWDNGLQIPPLTEDPNRDGLLSGPLGGIEKDALGLPPEISCLVDLLVDGSLGIDL